MNDNNDNQANGWLKFNNPHADKYEYDVEYQNDEDIYLTSDMIEPDYTPQILKKQNNSAQAFSTTDKSVAMTVTDAMVKNPEKIVNMEEVQYFMSSKADEPVVSTKHIEPDYYPEIESKLSPENQDFITTQKTAITTVPVNSAQNLSANSGSWKKPALIGAACLAAIWFFNQD